MKIIGMCDQLQAFVDEKVCSSWAINEITENGELRIYPLVILIYGLDGLLF